MSSYLSYTGFSFPAEVRKFLTDVQGPGNAFVGDDMTVNTTASHVNGNYSV